MKHRLVSRQEAEEAYSRELFGDLFRFGDIRDGMIVAIRLPERPVPGGSQGKGYLPLTYQYRTADGRTETLATGDGPEVDEARAFLRATVPGLAVDERVELWFEGEVADMGTTLSCCC